MELQTKLDAEQAQNLKMKELGKQEAYVDIAEFSMLLASLYFLQSGSSTLFLYCIFPDLKYHITLAAACSYPTTFLYAFSSPFGSSQKHLSHHFCEHADTSTSLLDRLAVSHAQQGEAARLAKERDALRTQMEGLEADLQAARAASAAMAANLTGYKAEVEVERSAVKATLADLRAQLDAAVADKENYAAQVNEVWCYADASGNMRMVTRGGFRAYCIVYSLGYDALGINGTALSDDDTQ